MNDLIINYKITCKSNDEEKLKLILIYNDSLSKLKRGFINTTDLKKEIDLLQNDLNQIVIKSNLKIDKTANIAKKADFILKEERYKKYLIAMGKLEDYLSKIIFELDEKFKIKLNSHEFQNGINEFDYCDIKLIKE